MEPLKAKLKILGKGLTLMEILVGTSITVVLVGLIYAIYISGNELWDIKRYQTDVQAQGRQTLESMASELRMATRTSSALPSPNLVIAPLPNNRNITFYIPRDLNNDTYLTDASGNTEWDTNNSVVYWYDGTQQQVMRSYQNTTTILGNNITDIRFSDITMDASLFPNEIKIVMALNKTTLRQRTIAMNFTSVVRLRN